MERQEKLRAGLHALGFDVVRFVRLDAADATRISDSLGSWLQAGHQADMTWMDRSAAKRADPTLVLENAKSAIVLGVNYYAGDQAGPGPRWARYALYQDYHDTIEQGLRHAEALLREGFGLSAREYRSYVDTGPVLERGWAERAGVGFIGKNAMMISREFGNWLFLAEILTSGEFVADPPLAPDQVSPHTRGRVGLHCGTCTRCMVACPTDAIRSPGVVDARRCISYQTIENRGIIPRELRAGIGNRIYGCDVCLEVCPWNRFAQASRSVLLRARSDLREVRLRDLLELTPARFAELFRGTAMKRTKLSGLLRNACIVAANTGAVELLPEIELLARHESAVVRAHAVWACHRLCRPGEARTRLAAARATETESAVLAEYAAEDVTQETS